MNDRYRSVCKAHDHIVKCRTKETKKVFISYGGYMVAPSEELLKASIRRMIYKVSKAMKQWMRGYYEITMQGVPFQRIRMSQ